MFAVCYSSIRACRFEQPTILRGSQFVGSGKMLVFWQLIYTLISSCLDVTNRPRPTNTSRTTLAGARDPTISLAVENVETSTQKAEWKKEERVGLGLGRRRLKGFWWRWAARLAVTSRCRRLTYDVPLPYVPYGTLITVHCLSLTLRCCLCRFCLLFFLILYGGPAMSLTW